MEFRPIGSSKVRSILENACDANGSIGFKRFTEIALYHAEIGYYRSQRSRVGKSQDTDFFTATSLKSAFAPIVLEASLGLSRSLPWRPEELAWVEIGAEPANQLLANLDTPFRKKTSITLDEALRIEGPAIVFSNELFDAQPFSSVVFRQGSWLERRIEVCKAGVRIVERPPSSDELLKQLPALPHPAPEGYVIDLPTGANDLLNIIACLDWQGVFLAFDYGKTWQSLAYDTPQGTGRAYRRHQQKSDLLESIGQQDITCHVCWDWLIDGLKVKGFQSIELQSQEAFALKKAPEFVKQVFDRENDAMGALRQLIHPSIMGQKFQALSAIRMG
jgi:SAM-dependent MidA family methyltransferase